MKTKKHTVEVEIPTGIRCMDDDFRCEQLIDDWSAYRCKMFPDSGIITGHFPRKTEVYRCNACTEKFGIEEQNEN